VNSHRDPGSWSRFAARIRGHPVHVMLVHFPIALWPAHFVLHLFGERIAAGPATGAVAFWLLTAGVLVGWTGILPGAVDLLRLQADQNARRVRTAWAHAATNGTVLFGFTVLCALEYARYPQISHTSGWLFLEGTLLLMLVAGCFLGGEITWGERMPPVAPHGASGPTRVKGRDRLRS
jgi:uncharacterized membrane protein